MTITKHAKKRIKERIGLPKRAHARHILNVLEQGALLSRKGFYQFVITHNHFLYIFGLNQSLRPILITTYRVSENMHYIEV
jgi:hypothetical protein